MYYVIEQSTDQYHQQTKIKKFRSESSALKYAEALHDGPYTYGCPESANNWHRTFRYAYHLEGRVNRKDKIFSDHGTSTYPRNAEDNLATYIRTYGDAL